jgi:ornithine carbamoyltransferase
MTLQERFGGGGAAADGHLRGLRVAWVGDGNNIAHTLMAAAPRVGLRLSLATPAGYAPDAAIAARAVEEAREQSCSRSELRSRKVISARWTHIYYALVGATLSVKRCI